MLHVEDEAVFTAFTKLEDEILQGLALAAVDLGNQLEIFDRRLGNPPLEIIHVRVGF